MANIFERANSENKKMLCGPCQARIENRITGCGEIQKTVYVVVVNDAYGRSEETVYATRAAARIARKAAHTYRKSY